MGSAFDDGVVDEGVVLVEQASDYASAPPAEQVVGAVAVTDADSGAGVDDLPLEDRVPLEAVGVVQRALEQALAGDDGVDFLVFSLALDGALGFAFFACLLFGGGERLLGVWDQVADPGVEKNADDYEDDDDCLGWNLLVPESLFAIAHVSLLVFACCAACGSEHRD